MVSPQQIKDNLTAPRFLHWRPRRWLGVHSSRGPSNNLWRSGFGSWQEGDGQPQATTQPASSPWLSALTPPHHHTAAPGDPGWAGRRCKCSALRTFSASVWKTQWERIQDGVGLKATSLKDFRTMRGAVKSTGCAGDLGTSPDLLVKWIHLFRGNSSLSLQGLIRTPCSKYLFLKNNLPLPHTPPPWHDWVTKHITAIFSPRFHPFMISFQQQKPLSFHLHSTLGRAPTDNFPILAVCFHSCGKEIQPVHPKGNQSWIFIGRTAAEAPILWPPDVKSGLIWKDPDAGKDGRQQEKGPAEDEMVGRHHWLNGHETEQTPGDSEGPGILGCCSPWGHRESDTTEPLNWTEA